MDVESAYHGLLTGLVTALWDEPEPLVLRPDRAAYQALMEYHDQVEARLVPDGDLRPLEGFAGKLVGAAARYAALHHLAHYGVSGLHLPVTAASVSWGIQIATWATEHHRFAVTGMGLVGNTADAERVLAWLKRTGLIEVTTREAQKAAHVSTAEQTAAALELLEEHGWARRSESTRKSGTGRKPSPRWAVHPRVAG